MIEGGRDAAWEEVRAAWWESTFAEREALVRRMCGPSSSKSRLFDLAELGEDAIVAKHLVFDANARRSHTLHMSIGLSQPKSPKAPASTWELAMHTEDEGAWTHTLLGDLLIYHLDTGEPVHEGASFPLGFYDAGFDDSLCLLFDNPPQRSFRRTSAMRGLVLWRDLQEPQVFETRTGRFRPMVATTITAAECDALQDTSPPHLMLMLERMGVAQTSDPARECVFTDPAAAEEWAEIAPMSEVEVMRTLARR